MAKRVLHKEIVMFQCSEDRSYAAHVLMRLGNADVFFRGRASRHFTEDGTAYSLDGVYQLGMDMNKQTPFKEQGRDVSSEEGFYFRAPVWELVRATVVTFTRQGSLRPDTETVAGVGEYLIARFEGYQKAFALRKLQDDTAKQFEKLGVPLSTSFPQAPDPRTSIFYLSGWEAHERELALLPCLVKALCTSLEHFIEVKGKC